MNPFPIIFLLDNFDKKSVKTEKMDFKDNLFFRLFKV